MPDVLIDVNSPTCFTNLESDRLGGHKFDISRAFGRSVGRHGASEGPPRLSISRIWGHRQHLELHWYRTGCEVARWQKRLQSKNWATAIWQPCLVVEKSILNMA